MIKNSILGRDTAVHVTSFFGQMKRKLITHVCMMLLNTRGSVEARCEEKLMQPSIFDCLYPPFKIKTPIRLIELFAGVGSQAMALRDIGADFEHYRVVEFDKFAIRSYNAIHGTNFKTMDIRDVHADDLGICEKRRFTYLLIHFLAKI